MRASTGPRDVYGSRCVQRAARRQQQAGGGRSRRWVAGAALGSRSPAEGEGASLMVPCRNPEA